MSLPRMGDSTVVVQGDRVFNGARASASHSNTIQTRTMQHEQNPVVGVIMVDQDPEAGFMDSSLTEVRFV